jgi:hypothetical protein
MYYIKRNFYAFILGSDKPNNKIFLNKFDKSEKIKQTKEADNPRTTA